MQWNLCVRTNDHIKNMSNYTIRLLIWEKNLTNSKKFLFDKTKLVLPVYVAQLINHVCFTVIPKLRYPLTGQDVYQVTQFLTWKPVSLIVALLIIRPKWPGVIPSRNFLPNFFLVKRRFFFIFFLLLSLAILKYRHYFLMWQTLKLNIENLKNKQI